MIITQTITLEEITCGGCGIVFAMPKDILEDKQRNAGSFYCPNGCRRGWLETDADRLRKQLAAKEVELRQSKCETLSARRQRDEEAAAKALVERKLSRVHKGVCPCCKRSFQNLQRHMATKHPEAK